MIRCPSSFPGVAAAIVAVAALTIVIPVPASAAAGPLKPTQLVKVLKEAGFPEAQWVTGVSVGLAESGGDPAKVGTNGRRGVWQIDPAQYAGFDLFDPQQNATAASLVWEKAQGWSPWPSFTNGEASRFFKIASDAVAGRDDPIVPATPAPAQQNCGAGPILPCGVNLALPSLDPELVVDRAIAGLLYEFDAMLTGEMEHFWNPLVAGGDDLSGKQTLGPGVVIDNTRLHEAWLLSFTVALSGAVLTLLFTVGVLMAMLNGTYEWRRLLLGVIVAVVGALASWTLVTLLVQIDNALIAAVNSQVTLELRDLPSWQGLGMRDPSAVNDIHDLGRLILVLILVLTVGLEGLVVFLMYFLRLVVLWALVATGPWVFAIAVLPAARGILIYWGRLLVGAIFFKFVNVLIFTSFVFMAAQATGELGFLNVIFVATLLLFMLTVPAVFFRALGEPSGAMSSISATWRQHIHHGPLNSYIWQPATRAVRRRLPGRGR